MSTYYLVGCGSRKASMEKPARDLYLGSLFRAAREYVEARAQSDHWWILSAKHGLVRPGALVEPYDVKLGGKADRKSWAEDVGNAFALEVKVPVVAQWHPKVVLLAGELYADPVEATLRWRGIEVSQPLRGLGLGARLSWFRRAREALEASRAREAVSWL